MSTPLKQRALASVGNVVRHVPHDGAQIFSFVASPKVRTDPWALYQRLHRRGPVRKGPYGLWLVASHAGITSILRDAPTTVDESQAEGIPGNTGDKETPFGKLIDKTLLFTDPPDHSRLRRLVSRSFTPRTVTRLREPVAELVAKQLAELRPRGRADLIADFALPLPVAVICELLGLPQSERERFMAWGRALAPRFDIDLFRSEEVNRLGDEAATAMVEYFDDLLDHPERCDPEGLVPALVTAQDDDDRLDRMEVIALCGLLLLAGFETTTNLIGNGVHSLLQQPDQLAAWRDDRVDPALAVDELLRHDGPVQFTQRVLLDDVELEGNAMTSKSLIALLIGAGNRDPKVFDDPDRLDLARNPNPHLSFSTGIHHCLGAALARLEAELAVPALLRELPGLELAARPTWRQTFVLRGFTELPIRWSA
jgi:unspecific monooxygenase